MRRVLNIILLIILFISILDAKGIRRISSAEISQIKQAISDEIYDYGYFEKFYQIDKNVGTPQHWKAEIRLYINPNFNMDDQFGEVIYKLMPFGKIYRLFFINENGGIILDGNPQNGFPITQPSHQTVFMDDGDVCRFQKLWLKTSIIIDTKPEEHVIQKAAKRQKIRTKFSEWEFKHAGSNVEKK